MRQAGLLIVDLQVGFGPKRDLVERIAAAARDYETVAMARFSNEPGSLYRTALDWHGEGGALALSLPDALILDKTGYGLTRENVGVLKV
jgi:hypothetical protein